MQSYTTSYSITATEQSPVTNPSNHFWDQPHLTLAPQPHPLVQTPLSSTPPVHPTARYRTAHLFLIITAGTAVREECPFPCNSHNARHPHENSKRRPGTTIEPDLQHIIKHQFNILTPLPPQQLHEHGHHSLPPQPLQLLQHHIATSTVLKPLLPHLQYLHCRMQGPYSYRTPPPSSQPHSRRPPNRPETRP